MNIVGQKDGKPWVSAIGRLGRDPELRYSRDGKPILKFSIASSDMNKNTTWFDCAAFGKTAELLQHELKKGTEVVVMGPYSEREYNKRDGTKGTSKDIAAFIVKPTNPYGMTTKGQVEGADFKLMSDFIPSFSAGMTEDITEDNLPF